ncbi:MAG: hypothetical protein J6D00_05765 [Christensenellaceae bacterium]|nr:hypothetical protein [Christensenellaceae bacterium]
MKKLLIILMALCFLFSCQMKPVAEISDEVVVQPQKSISLKRNSAKETVGTSDGRVYQLLASENEGIYRREIDLFPEIIDKDYDGEFYFIDQDETLLAYASGRKYLKIYSLNGEIKKEDFCFENFTGFIVYSGEMPLYEDFIMRDEYLQNGIFTDEAEAFRKDILSQDLISAKELEIKEEFFAACMTEQTDLILCDIRLVLAEDGKYYIQVKGNATSYLNEQMFAEVPEKWIDDLI